MDKTEIIATLFIGVTVFLLGFAIWSFSVLPDKIKYRRRQKHKDNPWLIQFLDILARLESARNKYYDYKETYKKRIEYLHEHVLFDTPEKLAPIQAEVRELETKLAEAKSEYDACGDEMDAHRNDEKGHCCKEYLYFF